MAIQVVREPAGMLEMYNVLEQCVFCNQETRHWHIGETNTPVCEPCAEKRDVSEIEG